MSSDAHRVTFTIGAAEVGLRLDQALAARVPGLSRRRARLLIDIGGVFVDGRRVKIAGKAMYAGESVVANLGGALDRATPETGREARTQDEARLPPFAIVHEDEDVVVLDKPSGLLTAPTPESDRNNLSSLLARRAGGAPVHVVHRIDLETSGLLVFAKTEDANRVLSEKFRTHDLGREYLAVVAGGPLQHLGAHPRFAALVVEVAESSLAYDRREKALLYARAGIAEYWIVNLAERRLEVHREPAPSRRCPRRR